MAEYITKKKKEIGDPQSAARKQEGKKRDPSGIIMITDEELKKITGAPEFGKDIIIIGPNNRTNKRSGGKVCKLATKGKGRAYGKNS